MKTTWVVGCHTIANLFFVVFAEIVNNHSFFHSYFHFQKNSKGMLQSVTAQTITVPLLTVNIWIKAI